MRHAPFHIVRSLGHLGKRSIGMDVLSAAPVAAQPHCTAGPGTQASAAQRLAPPVTMRLDWCAKSTVRTMCLCGNWCSSRPVSASHTRALKSADPVTARSPVSLSLLDHTAPCDGMAATISGTTR